MQDEGKKTMGAAADTSRQNTFDPDAVQHKVNRLNGETNVGDAIQNEEVDEAQRKAAEAQFRKPHAAQQQPGQGQRTTLNGAETPQPQNQQPQNPQAAVNAPSTQPVQQQPQGFGTRMIGALAERMGLVEQTPQQQQQPQQGQVAPPQQDKAAKSSSFSPSAVADKALGMAKSMEGKDTKSPNQPQGQQTQQEPQGLMSSLQDRLNPATGFRSEQQQTQQEQVSPPERQQSGFVSAPKPEAAKAPTQKEQATNLAVQGGMAYATRGQSLKDGSGAAVAGQVNSMQQEGGSKGIQGMDKAELAKALGAANGAKSAGIQQGGKSQVSGPPHTPEVEQGQGKAAGPVR